MLTYFVENCLVHGYIRDIKHLMSTQYKLLNFLPLDIHCIIECYQRYGCSDTWDEEHSSEDITITQSPDKFLIELKYNHDIIAFGRNVFSLGKSKQIMFNFWRYPPDCRPNPIFHLTCKGKQGIAEWRLQIVSLSCSWDEPPYIGIIEDSMDNLQMYQENSNWFDKGYQLSIGDGKILSSLTNNHQVCMIRNKDLKQMTYINIILDLSKRKLTFIFKQENKEDSEISVRNIKLTKYRLALSGVSCKSSEFALIR